MGLSFTEENYIKQIYRLSKPGVPVTTNAIANCIQTKASSVTDMLDKLAVKKLVEYEKYKGVSLTTLGKKTALLIVRKHRLWEVFLVQKLGFTWDKVHEIAEQLEHIQSDELIDKLDAFLGHPKFDPHGEPIPDAQGKVKNQKLKLLSECVTGSQCTITEVNDDSASFLQHLDKTGLKLGHELEIAEVVDYDKSLSVVINGKKNIFISQHIAKNILVTLK
ncbi:MAG TPA: metal-dependent transcriptional regulator [Flavobacteriales bacterium]|nr:metal-dependent transcriptional regulator [Flavobacteriales bacterium]